MKDADNKCNVMKKIMKTETGKKGKAVLHF